MSADRKPWQRWHRHRWSKWTDMRTTGYIVDVRQCEVCGKRELRTL